MGRLLLAMSLLGLVGSGCARPRPLDGPLPWEGKAVPSGMSREAWIQGHAAYARVRAVGFEPRPLLAIIDYSLPSSEPRLWVIDIHADTVVATDYVAHGWASGGIWPFQFSNRWGSNQSSLGVFLAREAYVGVRGVSLRLEGLEQGINDRARERGIVIHGSPFVSAVRAARGVLGRTEGCPAVPLASARRLVNLLREGSVIFAWYPDPTFLGQSRFLNRGPVSN